MKDTYEKPDVKVEEYRSADIITTSAVGTDDEGWIDKWY